MENIYKKLLLLYPAKFKKEYYAEMVAIFEQEYDLSKTKTRRYRMRFAWYAIKDICISLPKEYFSLFYQYIYMRKEYIVPFAFLCPIIFVILLDTLISLFDPNKTTLYFLYSWNKWETIMLLIGFIFPLISIVISLRKGINMHSTKEGIFISFKMLFAKKGYMLISALAGAIILFFLFQPTPECRPKENIGLSYSSTCYFNPPVMK